MLRKFLLKQKLNVEKKQKSYLLGKKKDSPRLRRLRSLGDFAWLYQTGGGS